MKPEEFDISIRSISELQQLNVIHRWEMMRHTDSSPVESAVTVAFDEPDGSDDTVALRLGVRYTAMRGDVMRPLLTYFIRVEFAISGVTHRALVTDSAVYLATGLLSVMLNVSIGALRGMLAIRTSGTFLSRHPLPMLSVADLLASLTASAQ